VKEVKEVHRKPFTLHHCWAELEHDEKYKNRDVLEVPKRSTKSSMGEATILDDNEASSEDGKRRPTQNSVAKNRRRVGRR
jgi:ppGpp synthetase/RelA/SpoT-type nucleotidyltranferase